ncbi:alpha-E domain-containing protein [Niallia sp. 01092]|uniref:alpha-E domain-containing protein n=1 Tax=unclassified Niallia TaxID=2837522 RepID=UPI003FD69C03
MLSRVADSLYWIAQNMERADCMAKLLSVRIVTILENHNPLLGTESDWKEVIEITSKKEDYNKLYDTYDRDSVIQYIAFSKFNVNSILSCIKVARENARTIREMIPIELWEIINELYLEIKNFRPADLKMEQLNRYFQSIREKYLLFQGIISVLMPRTEGYSFLVFGKYLEVIRKLAQTLDVCYHNKQIERVENEDSHYHFWSSVLSSLSGYDSYIQKYQASMDPIKIVNYLLFDDTLPRSASYSVQQLTDAFQRLEKQQINDYARKLYDQLEELHKELRYHSVQNLPISLHEYCQRLQLLCDSLGITIMETYYLGEMIPT